MMSAGCFSWWHLRRGADSDEQINPPEVTRSTNSRCANSLTRSCVQESPLVTISDEVRWSIHVLRPDVHLNLNFVWKLTEARGRSNQNGLHYGHPERGFDPVAICSQVHTGSVSARGHWSRTDDHSSVRGSLNSVFESCETIDQNTFIRRHRPWNKRPKSCRLRLAIS